MGRAPQVHATMTGIERFLVLERDGFKAFEVSPASFAEFLLRNGRAFKGRPLPARYSMKMPRMCYFNSSQIVGKNHRLRYCEGYVILADLGISIQHA